MTAIAGIWSESHAQDSRATTLSMLAAQQRYGPHHQSVELLGNAAFGRALYQLLPEDRFDRGPFVDPSGRFMLAADVRIDNRSELLDSLGRPRTEELSDAQLLLIAWCQWGDAALDKILGDFAFALWDATDKSLSLVRDPAGQRPLHYHRGDGFFAFASMPQGLHALRQVPRRLDDKQLAAFVADHKRDAAATFFEGIVRVEPGQLLKVHPRGIESRRYWNMPSREIRYPKEADYFEAFREQLDRATLARLRGAETLVGAHLSAGLDSSAVAATASRLTGSRGGRVVAFTSAPRPGFTGPVLAPRIGDESGIAAEVAALYSNMEHVIIRPEGRSPLDFLGRDSELFQEPVGHACNAVWWSAIHDEARARGISVMLTGEAGNLTISAGGLPLLAEFIRKGRWLRWWREARAIAGAGPSWRGVLATSFGPWTPGPIWRLLSRVAENHHVEDSPPLTHSRFSRFLQADAVQKARAGRPPTDNRRLRWEIFQQHEAANFRKGILAQWGVDERDPTADRRLAEFCFSLPADQLFSGGVTRRMARRALADRLPAAVLKSPRGYQYADWYERIDRASLERTIARIEAGPASSLLDFEALRDRAATWPVSEWNTMNNIAKYRHSFLKALSAGSFANRMSGESYPSEE